MRRTFCPLPSFFCLRMFLNDFEDLDIFVAGEFSQKATVESASRVTELSGIFDDNYQAMFDSFNQAAEGRNYCFKARTDQAAGIVHGDRLEINNRKFEVISTKPTYDGKLTELILKEDLSQEAIDPQDFEEAILFVLPADTWVNFPAANNPFNDWKVYVQDEERTEDFIYREFAAGLYQIRSSLTYTDVVFNYYA